MLDDTAKTNPWTLSDDIPIDQINSPIIKFSFCVFVFVFLCRCQDYQPQIPAPLNPSNSIQNTIHTSHS